MRRIAIATFILAGLAPAAAQQTSPLQNLQNEADKGIKTENSGASGYVGKQTRPGSAAQVQATPGRTNSSSDAPGAQNSGTGVAGAPGNKNGPPANGTVGQNSTVRAQDSSNIQGLPGNKSGPPAKH
ncbi:hypothetical protein JQ586_39670 [Bradyrhizobium jicamae]|nr:hypothetical protein [Bradyrhizobium jicamae]MBR0939444.1 hypothetical protein [Bradyrhizobium jicamae]